MSNKQTIEADIPEGYKATAFRFPEAGELFINADVVVKALCKGMLRKMIVVPAEDPPARILPTQPWVWGTAVDEMDKRDTGADPDDPDEADLVVDKYMDLRLLTPSGEDVLPIRVDHYELIYDGKWISKKNRELIAQAPVMYDLLKKLSSHLRECGSISDLSTQATYIHLLVEKMEEEA